MFQHKGALLFVAVLVLACSIHSTSAACTDYQDLLCVYVGAFQGNIGHGWSCSYNTDTIIVDVDGVRQYYHCKQGLNQKFGAALQREDIPKPPPPPTEEKPKQAAAGESDNQSPLVARILSALGLEDKASAQSCNFNGQSLCIYVGHQGQAQWYCNYDYSVTRLDVQYNYQNVLSCT